VELLAAGYGKARSDLRPSIRPKQQATFLVAATISRFELNESISDRSAGLAGGFESLRVGKSKEKKRLRNVERAVWGGGWRG